MVNAGNGLAINKKISIQRLLGEAKAWELENVCIY
jgi:hypothetical protein